TRSAESRPGGRERVDRLVGALSRPWVDRRLRDLPFPVHLRKRLEALGPTYIKLGQILSLREDILPRAITRELKNLLDRLPALPFERYRTLVAAELPAPLEEVFAAISSEPVGSASIGQIHRARLVSGDEVILKLVKPGIRETLR